MKFEMWNQIKYIQCMCVCVSVRVTDHIKGQNNTTCREPLHRCQITKHPEENKYELTSICLSVCLSVFLSVCLSINLSIHLSTYFYLVL